MGRFDCFMSVFKTLLILFFVVPMSGRAAEDPLVSAFASCAGRFSAELEHAWLLHTERISEIEDRRRRFINLLEATIPQDQHRLALSLRINAKAAHAQLLSQTTIADDADRSAWAIRRAQTEIDYCTGFLLES